MGKASRQKKHAPAQKIPIVESQANSIRWWMLAVLCLTAFLAFAQTLSYDFVFDDDTQVLRNPWIRDWSQLGNFFFTDVWRFAKESTTNYYRPLHMLAHAIGYSISGLQPWGFHLFNILLHCANTLLVALIAFRLSRSRFIALAGGFLFALHPMHIESIAWIAGITDPLCAVFYFGALYAYLGSDPAKGWKAALPAALLFLGALFSKEMAFTFPLAALLLDLCLGRRRRWQPYALFAAAFAIYTAFRINALSSFQVKQMPVDLGLYERILSSVVLMGRYLANVFVPFDISPSHVFYPTTTIWDPYFLLSSFGLLALAFFAWRFRKDRILLFLCGFLPLAFLPVMNFSGIGTYVYCDRYFYIPSLGACILIPLILKRVGQWNIWSFHTQWLKFAIGFAAVVGMIYAWVLWKNTYLWRDNFTLYSETLKRSPDSPLMADNLAGYYFDKGQDKEAALWLSRAQRNHERVYFKPKINLAVNYVRYAALLLREGKTSEALEYLEKSYAANPRNPAVLQNLGTVYLLQKDYAQARKYLEEAVEVNPRNEISYNNLSFISLQENQADKAIEYARKALEIFPKYGDAYLNLARGYLAKGLKEQAVESYRNAMLSNPLLQSAVEAELNAIESGK